jgi:hypothetical protein
MNRRTLKRPTDRVVDRRQLWRLKLAAQRRNRSSNIHEPLSDAVFTADSK